MSTSNLPSTAGFIYYISEFSKQILYLTNLAFPAEIHLDRLVYSETALSRFDIYRSW